ncbi:thiolase family protein [Bartonella tamiae]|uniref:Acetyl-CoA C-acetyltransferase n=1 Tax=Bartonella tamiae Th239 TaxID=1094558 RepID=J1K279_9HYPH|nr:thiolase family protein [Bartonella tamiae]EJF91210.1 acetyl-CoA C-acetyltransferase [Bartonella tamiae Th239]EJF93125.1 acetyl-CoA C-acetyltransferase [Bartonella tamiae Th307]
MKNEAHQAVIIAALRTPIARAYGGLAMVDVEYLAATLIKSLLERTNVNENDIDDVIIGNAAGGGGNLARLAALSAGLPFHVAGQTVDRQCGSGLEAIIQACRLIEAGAGSFYLAGGAESISTAPWRIKRPKRLSDTPEFYKRARFSPDEIGDPDMGIAAENIAQKFEISRARQDAFALQSHERAMKALKNHIFEDEIIPVQTSLGLIQKDESIREGLSFSTLSRLKPVFCQSGTVTAGNACPLNDGAAMALVTSQQKAREVGAKHVLSFIDSAVAGVDPNFLGIGPVASTQKLFKRQASLKLRDLTIIEFNEAFAVQVLASLDQLNLDSSMVNQHGGAIALGHPFGASGAILVTRLLAQMKDLSDASLGLATMGIGGGMGLSALFKPMHL